MCNVYVSVTASTCRLRAANNHGDAYPSVGLSHTSGQTIYVVDDGFVLGTKDAGRQMIYLR
jgi:hypothetical protein